ncbi:MAG TPA: sigma 54-interacting transcriptional regulator [Candidatus Sulfomarinibacteraceae bacterium]|nr:sigma 54-interacting transcriptional regulator [Candidatus Sulfomarinibacteraceae bacterium]
MPNNSILIVEDESLVARDIQNRLTKQGYSFAGWACSAEEAIAQVESSSPDLVLMDINLKGPVDGIEAAEQIRQRFDVPVVFVTAFADQETLNRAKIADPFGYILKPFSERELHSTIEIALYKHRIDRSLREQRAFLEALFQSVPVAVAVIADDGRVRMVNDHFIHAYGLNRAAGIESPIGALLGCPTAFDHPEACGKVDGCDGCRIRRAIDAALAGEAVEERGVRFESRRDGETRELTLAVTTAPLAHRGEKLAILILDDITELSGLRRILGSEKSFAGIVGTDPKMVEIFNTIREIADINVPVMVLGESGTGKELVARAIHDQGVRSSKSFVPVNCGALPDSLLESELFGHVRGAFTGASRDRKGRFQLADKGTIFLDEIGDLSPAMQVKFLRVLQEGTFEPVGGERSITVDARVICATNKDLEHEVEVGSFREDLFYRLCVVPITLPPLRDRGADIPLISQHIIEMESASSGGRRKKLSSEVLEIFATHPWPGNIRELQNALRFAFIKCPGSVIEPEHLPPNIGARAGRTIPPSSTGTGLTEADIAGALEESRGNRSEAAKLLGVSRATFYRHLAKLDRSDGQT